MCSAARRRRRTAPDDWASAKLDLEGLRPLEVGVVGPHPFGSQPCHSSPTARVCRHLDITTFVQNTDPVVDGHLVHTAQFGDRHHDDPIVTDQARDIGADRQPGPIPAV